MKMIVIVRRARFALVASIALATCVAQAEDNDVASDASADASGTRLQQVVVTARRRAEQVQSVPIAISVVTQTALEDNNVRTLGDLQYLVPSMSASTRVSRDAVNVSIRGQGSNSNVGLPAVVAYLNEVPVPTDHDGNLAGGPGLLFDLENVQVLKGPQGTLFGRNSTGGALLLQTARPGRDLGGSLQIGYGNHDNREVDGALNVPIVEDKLLARVAFNGQWREGFTQLLGEPGRPNGVDADNRDFWSVRGTVTLHATENFRNDAILQYSKFDSNGSPLTLVAVRPGSAATTLYPDISAVLQQQQAAGPRTHVPLNVPYESRGHVLAASNITSYAWSDFFQLRNIIGFTEANQVLQIDADGTVYPLLDIPSTPRDQTFRQITDEAQVLGKNGPIDWIVGGFWLQQDPPGPQIVQTSNVAGRPGSAIYRQGDRSHAAYAQGTYDLSSLLSGLSLTAGLRKTWDRRFTEGGVASAPTSVITKDDALTWTAGLNYQVTEESLLYLTSRRGYRAGGVNPPDSSGNSGASFGPEYVNDYELGIKSDWQLASIPVRTNVALYYQDYSDIQVQQIVVNPTTNALSTGTGNAASARVWGGELEALAQLTPDLQIGLNYNHVALEYTDFGAELTAAQQTTLQGTRTQNAVPNKYGAHVSYRLPLAPASGNLSVRLDWSHQDRSGDFTQPGNVIESFQLLNLAVNWGDIAGAPLDVSLFASNLTNEVYTIGGLSLYNSLGFAIQRYGEPRMYGVRLRYRFGPE